MKINYTKKEAIEYIKSLNINLNKDYNEEIVLQEAIYAKPTGKYQVDKYLWGLIKVKNELFLDQTGYSIFITNCPIDKFIKFRVYQEDTFDSTYCLEDWNESEDIVSYVFTHDILIQAEVG